VIAQVKSALTNVTYTIEYPGPLQLSQLALLGSERVQLNDGVTVVDTNLNPAAVANTGSAPTDKVELGVGASVGNLWSMGGVWLRDWSNVNGSVRSAQLIDYQNRTTVTVTGSILAPYAFSAPRTKSRLVPFDVGDDVNLEPDTTDAISPGGYGNVTVKSRAHLTLQQPGVYRFRSFRTEPDSVINFPDGPVWLYIADELGLKGQNNSPRNEANVLWATGTGGSVFITSPLFGTVLAPQAHVILSSLPEGQVHRGAVIARAIEIHQHTSFEFVSFYGIDQLDQTMESCDDCRARCLDENAAMATDPEWAAIQRCSSLAGSDSACYQSCWTDFFSRAWLVLYGCQSSCDQYCNP
jgi:hypothetical protein